MKEKKNELRKLSRKPGEEKTANENPVSRIGSFYLSGTGSI